MVTNQGGTGCPVNRDINLHKEDAGATDTDNDNESMSGSDNIVALGGLEAEGNPDELVPSNQVKLAVLTREINDLCQ